MGCSGSSAAGRSSGNCRRRMAPGSLCMPDSLNGGTMAHWRPYFAHCPQMRIWKTRAWTLPASKFTKVLTEGGETADKAVGRTRGGLNTKLHAIVDGLGNPVEFMLSAGNDHDSVHAVELLKKVEISGSNVLADRAYGAKTIRAYLLERGVSYVIPSQSNVSEPWPVDWWLYKERHLAECFFQKLKWFRRIVTRYDKLDTSFLAFVYRSSIAILLIGHSFLDFQTNPNHKLLKQS